MKTETRSHILRLIEKHGKIRPSKLRDSLDISAQALHRHLRSLVANGEIEAKGSAPFTRYALAGVPDLAGVASWMNAPTVTKSPDATVCETRDQLTARLPHLKSFVKDGLSENLLGSVISAAGEIGNNSFDHNLGQWRDVPGCWFETQVSGGHLWICIADRGQGIFQSLVKVHPHIKDDQMALKTAFETMISGRAPEKRGNGLKFVRKTVSTTPESGLACLSGAGRIFYGEQGETCLNHLEKHFKHVKGTITLVAWRLK